ncbi:MAG: hypothetical protein C0501_19340 [Isosphaera sp.]|nr:hypothetical protein [Isosphaera sp.]
MSDSPWLALRQAQEAMADSRPEDAHRLIAPHVAAGYRRAIRLAREVVRAYVARATKALDHADPGAAWADLAAAEALNRDDGAVAGLRQTLVRLGLVQARAALEAGNPLDAAAAAGRLRDHGVRSPDLDRLEDAARDWAAAADLADRGEFLRAVAELDRLRPRLPRPDGLDRYRAEVEARHARFREAVGRLYDAAEARRWRGALDAAEEVLVAAPEHREAKTVRGRAWTAVMELDQPAEAARATVTGDYPVATSASGTGHPFTPPAPAAGPGLPKRFLLWVDGVGGYLVCLGNRVTFGQATADGPVDVPLFADVSRLHAEVTRDGEGYVVESGKGVTVNGRGSARCGLAPGDRVTLGATCQFLFHRPVAVSSTARLELTSGHRLPVAVDGVLLMANELLLGPGPAAHVPVPGLPAHVLLYRSKDGLGVRVPGGPFRVDDRVCHDRAALPLPAVVTADAVTFAVEPVTGRL